MSDADMTNADWMVIRTGGQVLATVVDDADEGDVVFFLMSPEDALLLSDDLRVKAEQEEDDE